MKRTKQKTMLVPVDFSKNSRNALDYAVALAHKLNYKMVLLYVLPLVYPTTESSWEILQEMETMREKGRKKLMRLATDAKSKGIACDIVLDEGLAVKRIVSIARKEKADLIVMGTKGASGIKEKLIGSNTSKVLYKANCAVLVIPSRARFNGLKRIAYATDYHRDEMHHLKSLVEWAGVFRSKLEVLHISGLFDAGAEREFMSAFARQARKKVPYEKMDFKLLVGEVMDQLYHYMKKEDPGIMAVSAIHYSLIGRLFGGGVTKKLACHTKLPLLVFTHKK